MIIWANYRKSFRVACVVPLWSEWGPTRMLSQVAIGSRGRDPGLCVIQTAQEQNPV